MKLGLSRTIVHLILRPATRKLSANILWAFFMSTTKHIRFHAPVSMVNALTAFWCSATGQRETVLLFIQRFYKQTF